MAASKLSTSTASGSSSTTGAAGPDTPVFWPAGRVRATVRPGVEPGAKMVVRVSQTSPPSAPPEPPFSTGATGVAEPQAVAPMQGGRAQLWRIAAALTYRDFRVLWLGACTSSIGTWMQKVAQSWLVLELTDSAWYLALDSFVGEAPLLLFTLIGGVVADRQDRRKLLLVSQVVQMSSAFALALLVATGHVTIWYILGPVVPLGMRAGVRRPRLSVAHPVAHQDRAPAERGRAQLDPVQHRARHRPAAGGCGAPPLGHGVLFHAERHLVPRGHRVAARAAHQAHAPGGR